MNLVWEDEETSTILALMNQIPNMAKLSDFFTPGSRVKDCEYVFKGMVVFWGAHYYLYQRVITPEGTAWV